MLCQKLIVCWQLLATGKTTLLSRIRFTSPVSHCSQKDQDKRAQNNQLSKASNPFCYCKTKEHKCKAHFGNNKFWEEYTNEFSDKLFKLLKRGRKKSPLIFNGLLRNSTLCTWSFKIKERPHRVTVLWLFCVDLHIAGGKSAGFQRSHLCRFVILLHSSCTTGGVKYIEINSIPQITLANKRIKSILMTVFRRGFVALMHFFYCLWLLQGREVGTWCACVFLGTIWHL